LDRTWCASPFSAAQGVNLLARPARQQRPAGECRALIGDRLINDAIPQGDLKSLEGRKFDAVIDDPASDPRWVRQSATVLKDSGSYLFVSSTGVFLPYLTANNTERDSVRLVGGPTEYGPTRRSARRS